jgi:hypothetical protein
MTSHAHLLTPASKALLLHAAMTCSKPVVRVTVVTERETVLASTPQAMKDANVDANAAIILNPYYKSSYSSKQITAKDSTGSTKSVTVEEGEGLGPRKELFFLLAEQLQSQWQPVAAGSSSTNSIHSNSSSSNSIKLSAREGNAEVKLQLDASNTFGIREGLQIRLDSGTIGSTVDTNQPNQHHSCIITKVRDLLKLLTLHTAITSEFKSRVNFTL